MSLMSLQVAHNVLRGVFGHGVGIIWGSTILLDAFRIHFGWEVISCLLQLFYKLLKIHPSITEENAVFGLVVFLGKTLNIFRFICPHLVCIAKNVASYGMPLEDKALEIVVYQFRRRVVIAFYLIAHHFFLFVKFLLRISATKYNIREQVNGSCCMLFQYSGIIHSIFLGGESIQFATNCFQTVYNIESRTVLGTLECYMFAEMSHTVFKRRLVASTCIYLVATIGYSRHRGQMNNA